MTKTFQPPNPAARSPWTRWPVTVLLLSIVAASPGSGTAEASDHIDAPATQGDAAVDLADFYAWHTERGTIVAIITFSPLLSSGDDPVYDDGVVYVVNIDNTATVAENNDIFDNDNDHIPDIQIDIRFGQNDVGEWGVQILDAPGSSGPMVGAVETELVSGTVRAMAGPFDDPFFFDFDGFTGTVMNLLDDADPADIVFASLAAGAPVDFFEGLNVMAIVIEFDAETAVDGNADNFLQLWATSAVAP